MDDTTEAYVQVLREAGIDGDPADEWQVRDLESNLAVNLPAAYRAFLLLAGKWFDPLVGSHCLIVSWSMAAASRRFRLPNCSVQADEL